MCLFARHEHDERLFGTWLLSGMDSLFEISFASDGSFRGDDLVLEGLPGTKIRATCTLHGS